MIDAEVVAEAEEVTAIPLGWCLSGDCGECPGILPEQRWPDPARRGSLYTVPAKACSHPCHQRHQLLA